MRPEKELREYIGTLLMHVKRKSTPGIPLCVIAKENKDILDDPETTKLLVSLVVLRLQRLAKLPLDASYEDRYASLRDRLVDLVRVFVKLEPHRKGKVIAKRWRLICSISLVDQMVERVIWHMQAKREILRWDQIPSKPGMGSSDDQIASLYLQVESLKGIMRESTDHPPLVDRDAIASDMQLKEWLLFSAQTSCLIEYDFPVDSDFVRIAHARHKLATRPVFMLSNGVVLTTKLAGLMLSGRYVTSFHNSRGYVFCSAMRGERALCMGDDTIETNLSDMSESEIIEFYESIGMPVEVTTHEDTEGLEFCSMTFARTDDGMTARPKRWQRTLYRLLSKAKRRSDGTFEIAREAYDQFAFETRNMDSSWAHRLYGVLEGYVAPDLFDLEEAAESPQGRDE